MVREKCSSVSEQASFFQKNNFSKAKYKVIIAGFLSSDIDKKS